MKTRKKMSVAEQYILWVWKDIKCKTSDCYTIEVLTDNNDELQYTTYTTNGNFWPQWICMAEKNFDRHDSKYKELINIPYSIYQAVFLNKIF